MLWEARATVKSSICGMATAAVTRSATHAHTHTKKGQLKRKKQQQDAVATAPATAATAAAAAQTAKGNFALNYYIPFMQSIRVRPLGFSAGLRHVLLPPQTHTHTLSQNFKAQGSASGGMQGWFCG